jgi:hypothetical protein
MNFKTATPRLQSRALMAAEPPSRGILIVNQIAARSNCVLPVRAVSASFSIEQPPRVFFKPL